MSSLKVISEYVAPWALCREEIPIHLLWKADFKYDRIQIDFPSDIEIKELLNVERHETTDSGIVIKALKTPNFLGFYAQLGRVCEEQHQKRHIKIDFYSGGELKYTHTFVANIYRPMLSLLQSPEKIVLSDKVDIRKLINISMKLSGFGRVQIKPEISTGGEFLARADRLYYELARRIASTFRLEEGDLEAEKAIEIDAAWLQSMAESFIENMRAGKISLEIDKSDLEEFRAWISDPDNADNVMKLVHGQLENLLIQSLLFYLEKYPSDNVELGAGNPYTLIESATRKLRIRFRYKDALKTEYPPVEVEIPIEDRRTDRSKVLEVPINIRWEEQMTNPLTER